MFIGEGTVEVKGSFGVGYARDLYSVRVYHRRREENLGQLEVHHQEFKTKEALRSGSILKRAVM